MRTIAILCGRYLPGFKDGGPLRTVVNICDCLGDEYHLKIITNDRDHGDTQAYPSIVYDQPNQVGNAEVWYLKPNGFSFATIKKLVKDADVVYCCGPYDDYAYKTMILKRLGKIKQPLVIASMGTFSAGAIRIKSRKKKVFFAFCKFLGLFKKVQWSVTSDMEEQDVKCHVGKYAICHIAEDLPRKVPELILKEREEICGIFLSRICEMKNLLYVIEVLKQVKSNIVFDIYGVIEDADYWEKCQCAIKSLPPNVIVTYRGEASPERAIEIFSGYDFFLFPTLGENYGHVIFEALAGGCIPIISDQTPWQDLGEQKVGAVLPLGKKETFVSAIEDLNALSKEELAYKKQSANIYAKKKYEQSVKNTGYRQVFEL